MNPVQVTRYTILEVMRLALMGVALFWSAGRLGWWAAWAALAVVAGWMVATAVSILRANSALLSGILQPSMKEQGK